MTTTQKNEWITLEDRYLQKHKQVSKDKRSSILSQMTFCTDGVIIKKFMQLNDQGGITVQTYNLTMEEVKANETSTLVNEIDLLEVREFSKNELKSYLNELA